MKTAILFGVAGVAMLAACGGTGGAQGQGPEAVGTASESLTGTARREAASCMVHDATLNKDFVVMAGGFTSTPSAVTDIDAYDVSGATWLSHAVGQPLNGKVLGTARGLAKGIKSGNDCYVVGGSTAFSGAAALKKVDKIHVDNGTWTISAVNDLVAARSNFALTTCGSSKLMAIGGRDNGTYLSSIEIFDGTNWNTVSTTSPSLSEGRSDFSFASLDSNYSKFLVAGGQRSTTPSNQMDAIVVSNSACAYNTDVTVKRVKDNTGTHANLNLGTRRAFSVAFPIDTAASGVGHSDTFAIAAGIDDSTSLLTTVLSLTMNDWSGPYATFNTNLGNLPTGTASPAFLYKAGVPYLIGGVTDPTASLGTSATISAVQSYSSGWSSATALTDSRWGHIAEYAPNGTVYITAGVKVSGSPLTTTYLTSDETR